MSDSINWHLFLISAIAITLTPGLGMLYAISNGIQHGKKGAFFAVCGLETGALLYLFFSIIGLVLIFQHDPFLFKSIQFIGSCYLIYLGLSSFWSAFKAIHSHPNPIQHSKTSMLSRNNMDAKNLFFKIYFKGLILNFLNPKVGLFFIAFLPQFITKAVFNLYEPLLTMGCIAISFGFCANLSIGLLLSTSMSRYFLKKFKHLTYLSAFLPSTIFIPIGIYSILTSFPP